MRIACTTASRGLSRCSGSALTSRSCNFGRGMAAARQVCAAQAASVVEVATEVATEPVLERTPPRQSGPQMSEVEPPPRPEPGVAAAPPVQPSPGEAEREKFKLHWSVDMWRDFKARAWFDELVDGTDKPVPQRLRDFLSTLSSALGTSQPLGSGEAAQYWAYHIGRSGLFTLQAAVGLVTARAIAGDVKAPASSVGLPELLSRGWVGPLTEALLMFYQDYSNIQEGRYKLPWDMVTPNPLLNRQFNPLFILSRGALFVEEAVATLQRRNAGKPEEVWMQSDLLPPYFTNTYHYQTDGWLSQRSAQVYESSTETLFVGRQDAMQRSTLVPLSDFMEGKDDAQLRALEVGCGTGRFATFVKDNYPGLDLTLLDLSPFYLAEARGNLRRWKEARAKGQAMGGVDGTGTHFVQGAAEAIPAPDASFDVVYSVYLLHELPPEVRKQAIHEMARVCKPGGVVIITDSYQLGDRRAYDKTAANFGGFNEPYYESYLSTRLSEIAEEAGLQCGIKAVASTSKTLSFTKPPA